MHPMLNTAIKAARKAGAIINRASLELEQIRVASKQTNDFVTEVDHAAEQAIIATLSEAYPDHAVLAEESGAAGDSEYVWIVDPLDGTTNFLHGFPQYAVSIGLQHRGQMTQAVVYDVVHNELFTATRGRGAFVNDRRISVSSRTKLQDALLGTGFPYREFGRIDQYLALFKAFAKGTAGMRRPGSASLDLAYVAAGRLDGFFEMGLAPWDMAAGSLLVLEAGGLVGDFKGDEGYLESGDIVCGNPKVFAQMIATISANGAA
jgi:myo-inositol-1(or 4)-monophosphatase